ncbi:MAG: 4Fe-4S dicluster domain-containing protein [Armatimonadota bacterium]|nr:4Fe-4S dicluster domain-containing protein [Armatimonadota bacterium]
MAKQHAWYFNQFNCIGCRACEAGCKQEFDVPVGVRRRRVVAVDTGTYPNVKRDYVSMACNHCAEPACVKACPTGALYKRAEDGLVLFHVEKCVGCQRCRACPYGAPQYHPETGKIDKCTLCAHRLEKGLAPACALTCMGLALESGTLEEVKAKARARAVPGFADPSLTNPSIRFKPGR